MLGIEKRFNVSEEAKVPKDLLKQVHAHMQAAYDKQPIPKPHVDSDLNLK